MKRRTAKEQRGPGHVCMVVHSYYPVGEPRAEREARAAVEAGYVVDVVCLRRPNEPAIEVIDAIRSIRLPVQHRQGVSAVRSILEYTNFAVRATLAVLRVHRKSRIDIVYIHAPPDFLVVAALLPKIFGARVVLDIHDLSPDMFDVRFGGRRLARIVKKVLRSIERGACAVADRVVTVHEPYRRELVANGVPSSKISVVMNAPAEEAVERARSAGSENGGPRDAFLVAYHGTVTHWYGVELIVEAIARLEDAIPDLHALILGQGDALASVEALAQRLGVKEHIEFSRLFVSHEEALHLVAHASCGVIPNRHSRLNRFALSSKLFDYVLLGVPVVVARLETLAAHFSPDEVTFFEPDDADSLAEAIAWVAKHPEEAGEKAQRARKRADAYSWERNRARLLETISFAASRR
jgi:glycosyltransferase involved in cell wall biosynthesis